MLRQIRADRAHGLRTAEVARHRYDEIPFVKRLDDPEVLLGRQKAARLVGAIDGETGQLGKVAAAAVRGAAGHARRAVSVKRVEDVLDGLLFVRGERETVRLEQVIG